MITTDLALFLEKKLKEKHTKTNGVYVRTCLIFKEIIENKEPVPMTKIRENILRKYGFNIPTASISRNISALNKLNLIKKYASEFDARVKFVKLTKIGEQLNEKIR